jgi:hypothetical protein
MTDRNSSPISKNGTGPVNPQYVIPFGRVPASGDAEPPDNETMVGRESERARFIDMLASRGATGAYLITGRRGIGKSSFVRHCLSEYNAAIFKRFLRGNTGKSFWDMLGLMLFASFIIVASILLSSFISIAADLNLNKPDGTRNALIAIVALPALLLCIYPFIYAWQLLEVQCRETEDGKGKRGSPLLPIVFLVIFVSAWFLTNQAPKPEILMSSFFCSLGVLYAFVQIWCYQPGKVAADESRNTSSSAKQALRSCRKWAIFFIFCLITVMPCLVAAHGKCSIPGGITWSVELFCLISQPLVFLLSEYVFSSALQNLPILIDVVTLVKRWNLSDSVWQIYMIVGFFFLFLGIFFRMLHLGRVKLHRCAIRMNLHRSAIRDAFKKSAISYFLICMTALIVLVAIVRSVILEFAVSIGISIKHLWTHVEIFAFFIFAVSVVVFVCRAKYLKDPTRPPEFGQNFVPQPALLLSLKAVLSVFVGVQLAKPLFSSQLFNLLVSLVFLPSSQTTNSTEGSDSPGMYLFLFQNNHSQLLWFISAFFVISAFYFVEYEWIFRPYAAVRDEGSLDPSSRPPWEDKKNASLTSSQKFQYRQKARLTFPGVACAIWLPTLTVTINLGFEQMNHKRVVYAMLAGLRTEYHRLFLAWHAPVGNIIRFIALLVLLLLVAQTGHAWFELPGVQRLKEIVNLYYKEKKIETSKGELQGACNAYHSFLAEVSALYKNSDFKKWMDDEYTRAIENKQKLEQNPGKPKKNPVIDGVITEQDLQLRTGLRFICTIPASEIVINFLYFDILSIRGIEEYENSNTLLFKFTDANWPLINSSSERAMSLRIYHLLLFLFFFQVGRRALFWLPLLPYKRNLAHIDELLESLSSKTVSRKGNSWSFRGTRGLPMDVGVSSSSEVSRDPTDPRIIELACLDILKDLQNGSIAFLRGSTQRFSIPAPEITFVFDELDKLGLRVDSEQPNVGETTQDSDLLDAERKRSLELHRLLSDLKRLLSAAPARFIFIGGRMLHDEWLADLSNRQPLLTSIFNAQIHLPSLLADHSLSHTTQRSERPQTTLHARIGDYLALQHYRSQRNMQRWLAGRWRPFTALGSSWAQPEAFFQPKFRENYDAEIKEFNKDLIVLRQHDGLPMGYAKLNTVTDSNAVGKPEEMTDDSWKKQFLDDFENFLAYRSTGTPKRLQELLLSFIQPVGRFVPDKVRWREEKLACTDVMFFDDNAIYRIQFISSIYRHLMDRFEMRLFQRDEKIVSSLFYLTDFLFKFHHRAFTWSSLEHLDELIHIHRAPDLRHLLEELLEQFSDQFLHPVLNGMYGFRFRSEIALEIDYLSRVSKEDLAAFNFTLDESQALKRIYSAALKSRDGDNISVIVSLGELYEYDQEYETARQYYRRAVELVDRNFERLFPEPIKMTTKKVDVVFSPFAGLLFGMDVMKNAPVFAMSWSVTRLRLMLQVGMTFEIARNLERAEAEYWGAHALSERVIDAFVLGAPISDVISKVPMEKIHPLKHVSLLYQPIFAVAWVAEKLVGNVDTSLSMLEAKIKNLRKLLPLVNKDHGNIANDIDADHANLALVTAELHRKIADLSFFKGRQFVPIGEIEKFSIQSNLQQKNLELSNRDGYLLRAHYHYAVAIHDIRYYAKLRVVRSSKRYQLITGDGSERTFMNGQWPSYIFLAIANSLNDLSDSLLSRVSLFGLMKGLQASGHSKEIVNPQEDFTSVFQNWFEHEKYNASLHENISEYLGGENGDVGPAEPSYCVKMGELSGWIGDWNSSHDTGRDASRPLIKFSAEQRNTIPALLLMVLRTSELSADYFIRGGFSEEGARRHLKTVEIVANIFWWMLCLRGLKVADSSLFDEAKLLEACQVLQDNRQPFACCYLKHMWKLGASAAKSAYKAFGTTWRDTKRKVACKDKFLQGGLIPATVLTVSCSLRIAGAELLGEADASCSGLDFLISEMNGHDSQNKKLDESYSQGNNPGLNGIYILKNLIERQRYPLLNRLNAMNIINCAQILKIDEYAEGDKISEIHILKPYVTEWISLFEHFNADLHFTPFTTGITLSWMSIILNKHGTEEDKQDALTYAEIGVRHLSRAKEICSMGRAYYELISNLYYLYDDFNDKHIHFQHALQMAGSELTIILMKSTSDMEGFKP